MSGLDPMVAPGLSDAGAARRDALRSRLVRRVGWRGRRRRAAQVVLVTAAMILGYHVVSPVMPSGGRPDPVAPSMPVAVASPTWRIVHDDPTVLARYATAEVPTRVEFLDDAELRQELAQAGRQPALVRVGQRVIVLAQVDDWRPAP